MRRMLLMGMALWGAVAGAETYAYDRAGRVTQVTYDDGSSISYEYDAAGNLLAQRPVGVAQQLEEDPPPTPKSCGCSGAGGPLAGALLFAGVALRVWRGGRSRPRTCRAPV